MQEKQISQTTVEKPKSKPIKAMSFRSPNESGNKPVGEVSDCKA